jgi:hypothetical protein
MNYKEFQKRNKRESEILPGDPKSFGKKHKPKRDFLTEEANPFQIIAVISMFIFGGLIPNLRLNEIPAIFCFITVFLYLIRSHRKGSFENLTLIWLFNAIIWTCNFIFLT